MFTNHILEEKAWVQRELAEEAEYDVHKYMANISRIVQETETQYGVEFKFSSGTNKTPMDA